jgi:predicted CoA-binding protein
LDGLSEDTIRHILESFRTVAVVGLSRDPAKPSHAVAKYLQSAGYHIIPVNPFCDQILGEKCYRSLLDVPETIEVVDVFRPSEDVPAIVDDAITIRNRLGTPKVVWMQLGIVNEEAARRAEEASLMVVMDRCMRMEHKHLAMESETS